MYSLQIRGCVDKYSYVYVFSVENMRNAKLKDVRNEWRTSRYVRTHTRIHSSSSVLTRTYITSTGWDVSKLSIWQSVDEGVGLLILRCVVDMSKL